MKLASIIFVMFCTSGCSTLILGTAKYSDFEKEVGHDRTVVISKLGEPVTTEFDGLEYTGDYRLTIDTYIVSGRVFDPVKYQMNNAGLLMSLGLLELVFFPMSTWEFLSESAFPSEKYMEITYIKNRIPTLRVREIEP